MTLSHAVVAWVQASELSNTAALPRACAASSPCSEANAAAPTTPPSRTVLPVAAVAEALCSAARSMPGTDAGSHGKTHDGSPCGNLSAMGSTASTSARDLAVSRQRHYSLGCCFHSTMSGGPVSTETLQHVALFDKCKNFTRAD